MIPFHQRQIRVALLQPGADHRRMGAAAGDKQGIGLAPGLLHGLVRQQADLLQERQAYLG